MRARRGTSLRRVSLYVDTVRGMRVRQLAHRVRRLLAPRILAVGAPSEPPSSWYPQAAGLAVERAPQSGLQRPPHTCAAFTFVGRKRRFSDDPNFWRSDELALLFAFHLHAFAELARYAAGPRTAAGDDFWAAVIDSWLRHEGEPSSPGWHPYPMSGRIMAWSAAISSGGWSPELERRMLGSLVCQAHVLRRSIEHDIGGNHVLRNAAALVFAGVCLGDPRLESRGLRLLRRELESQLLADGGHEERSTAYHRAILADLDDVASLLTRAHGDEPQWLERARLHMRTWEREMVGPDGRLALLNDAWEGPAEATPAERKPISALRESGYVVLRHGRDQVIVDAGPIAPPHLPPHAHADVLSFVLWADGRQLVVDPGSFAYTGPERLRFRRTAAHNTVEVDDADQCELWGDFRAAFMPRISRLDVLPQRGDVVVVVGRHDGYRRLADPVEHERWFVWVPASGLIVVDVLHARRAHRVRSRLHVAPEASGAATADRLGPFSLQALGVGDAPSVVAGEYASHLGVRTTIAVIERASTVPGGEAFGWSLLRAGASATLTDRTLEVRTRSGEGVTVALT